MQFPGEMHRGLGDAEAAEDSEEPLDPAGRQSERAALRCR